MATERAIMRANHDPRFQTQLIDHKNKIDAILDMLKSPQESPFFEEGDNQNITEELKEESITPFTPAVDDDTKSNLVTKGGAYKFNPIGSSTSDYNLILGT